MSASGEKHSPLEQFEITPFVHFEVGSVDLAFTNSSLAMVITTAVITLFLTLSVNTRSIIPSRVQLISELSYGFIAQLLKDTVGEQGRKYFPFVFTIFMFVLIGNMLGMIPYSFTFTSHIIVTFALAMFIFLFITLIGIFMHGFKFFGLFVPKGVPMLMLPLMIPIEIISYLSRPISLSVRLFANMMAGHTMLKIFASFVFSLGIFGFAPLIIDVALTALEVLIAFLQAYVFTILTCIYLNEAINLH